MAPATQVIRTNELSKAEYSEKSAIGALYDELSKGIESLKKNSKDALWDIKSTKKYILDTFKYREYAENFSKKIKKAIKELDSFPKGYEATGSVIEGLSIYFKPYSTYLIFFVVEDSTITVIRVLKDRMYWQSIIKKMQTINR